MKGDPPHMTSENVCKVLEDFATTKELVVKKFGDKAVEWIDVVVESVEALENEIIRLTPLADASADLLRVQTERADRAEACNDAMREPMKKLRELLDMPAQGEGTVINTTAELVAHLRRALKETEAAAEDIRLKNARLVLGVRRVRDSLRSVWGDISEALGEEE